MLIGFHFSNEICQMSTILQLKDIPWGKEKILEIVYNSQGKFQVPDFWELFWIPARLKNAKYHVFPLELSFQKMYSCQVIRKLLDYGPLWMSEEVNVLKGGGGERGGIEDGCELLSWKTVL